MVLVMTSALLSWRGVPRFDAGVIRTLIIEKRIGRGLGFRCDRSHKMMHFNPSADSAGARKPLIRGRKETACLQVASKVPGHFRPKSGHPHVLVRGLLRMKRLRCISPLMTRTGRHRALPISLFEAVRCPPSRQSFRFDCRRKSGTFVVRVRFYGTGASYEEPSVYYGISHFSGDDCANERANIYRWGWS